MLRISKKNPDSQLSKYIKLAEVGIYSKSIINTITRCEICSKLTMNTQNNVTYIVLVSLLLSLNYDYFEQVITG